MLLKCLVFKQSPYEKGPLIEQDTCITEVQVANWISVTQILFYWK